MKSLAKTKTVRPLMVPQPVTTPSPGILTSAMPKSIERCSTNMSNSSNEPRSKRSSILSRAVSLPPRVLRRDALLAAAEPRMGATDLELLDDVTHVFRLQNCTVSSRYSDSLPAFTEAVRECTRGSRRAK